MHVGEIASQMLVEKFAVGFKLTHAHGNVIESLEVERAIGIVICLGGITILDQLTPEGFKPRLMPDGGGVVGKDADGESRSAIDSKRPVVDTSFDGGVIRKVQLEARCNQGFEFVLFSGVNRLLSHKLREDAHPAATSP